MKLKKYEKWFLFCALLAWIELFAGYEVHATFSMLFMIFICLLSIIDILLGE